MERDMKFIIEQIAIYPPDPKKAIELLTALGATDWSHDLVVAEGKVDGDVVTNVGLLSFNYQLNDAKEFEVLSYKAGDHWMREYEPSVSHFGMHCTVDELDKWKGFFKRRNISIAQEVDTLSHTNPVIAGKRLYHYCIFDTRAILGVDLKFIVRKDATN